MKRNLIIVLFISLLGISADEPKMTRVKITEGVTASLPKDFVAMSDDDIAQKYPSTKKPLAMFTSLDRTIDFGLNVSKSSLGGDYPVLQKLYKATLYDLYSDIQFIQEGIVKINGRDFIVFEFTSVADGNRKYSYLQYTAIANRVYIYNFTCGAEKKATWQPIAKIIMNSISMDSKKLKETVEDTQPVHKGKRPVDVIKEQKAKKK